MEIKLKGRESLKINLKLAKWDAVCPFKINKRKLKEIATTPTMHPPLMVKHHHNLQSQQRTLN